MSTAAGWERLAWAQVEEGDQVWGADGMTWTCVRRNGKLISIERPGRARVTRTAPDGPVLARRGQAWHENQRAIEVFRAASFTVDVVEPWTMPLRWVSGSG